MSRITQQWRLILSPSNNGPFNMAIDEVLLRSCQDHEALPILRFYSWEPACLSLGIAQSIDDVDLVKLKNNQWDIVRRPTGGKGILHIDELTYSVIASTNHPLMAGGVLPSYQRISSVFIYALKRLGIDADSKELNTPSSLKSNGPVCFETPSNYEIVYKGKKLIGSAQARKSDGVLQHGSIPLFGDVSRIVTVLRTKDLDAEQIASNNVRSRATTILEAACVPISPEKIISAIIEGFESLFGFSFIENVMSNTETQDATSLMNEKYTNPTWISRI